MTYERGKIYLIKYENNVYVGSTICSLSKRLREHKNNSQNPNYSGYNMTLYQKMRETNPDNWTIELYEEYPCGSVQELRKREGEVIRELATGLNTCVAGRNKKEYYEENKDAIYQKHREYIKRNWEKRKKYLNEYNKMRRIKCLQHRPTQSED